MNNLIGEIQKNTIEKIRIQWAEYQGRRFLDVRVYFEDSVGEWKPTKKGIAIAPDKIESLAELLRKAQETTHSL